MPKDLIGVIKQKQAEIAKLQAELDEARALLGGGIFMPPHHGRQVVTSKAKAKASERTPRRSADVIVPGSAAYFAAEAIRAKGHPMHAHDIIKFAEEKGTKIKLTTLVGSLSRWVKRRMVFYRAGRNIFGLVEMRKV